MEQPLSLMQHLHRKLVKTRLDDVFELTNRDLLNTFPLLAVLNFTSQQAPEDLGN
jgi:hypothetical protein